MLQHNKQPGDVIAGRFRIIRLLGEGGMGAVYEATDLELGEAVALKTLLPARAGVDALARFKREIQLARRVTHPNVCRVYDLIYHRDGAVDLVLLSMELLRGETLSQRIARGRLSTEAALPIVTQIAAGLTAAHEAGIIHRDFKPSNVILTPDKGAERAVVTDFGLALNTEAAAGDAQLTQAGIRIGTPAYMAPEQVEGQQITPAADIYALGLVMYEMVTGQQPFRADTPVAVAIQRLAAPVPSARESVPGLDANWERVITRCLQKEPGRRFASAVEVAKSLSPPSRTRRNVMIACAGLLLAFITTLAVMMARRPPAVVNARRSIALVGFRNLSTDRDVAWLSTALAEMLTTELAAGGTLRTISGETVGRMKTELALASANSYAADTLQRIRRNIGADLVITGAYLALGDGGGRQVRLDVSMQDAVTGETVHSLSDTAEVKELFSLAGRVGAQLRGKLGLVPLSRDQQVEVRASVPASPEAARLLAEGTEALRSFDAIQARSLLEQAVTADPINPLIHYMLSTALVTLGYEDKGKESAQRAAALSSNLPRDQKLLIEAHFHQLMGKTDQAVEAYRRLFRVAGDNVDYGYRLAIAQINNGKPKDCLETVAALRKLPPPGSDDARIDLAEARAAEASGDYSLQQQAAARAAAKGRLQDARILVAQARHLEGAAWARLSALPKANEALEEARKIYALAQDRNGVARTLSSQAVILAEHGDPAGARKGYEEALGITRESGNRTLTAQLLNNLANVATDLASSLRYYEESLAIKKEMGDKAGIAVTLNNLGETHLWLGDVAAARKSYEEALKLSREAGDKRGAAFELHGLGDVLLEEDDLPGARKKYEEALVLRYEINTREEAAQSRTALAQVLLEEGNAAACEAAAAKELPGLHESHQSVYEAMALLLVSSAQLAQGRIAEAERTIAQASEPARKSDNAYYRLLVALQRGRVQSAYGKHAEARKGIEGALEEARSAGIVNAQFEARLALGGVLRAAGDVAEGNKVLDAVQKDARSRGFARIARISQRR